MRSLGMYPRPAAVAAEASASYAIHGDALPAFPFAAAPRASIIIPIYNQLAHTQRCLRSIAATPTHHAFEVVVVDDGSTDTSAQWLAGCTNVRVLHKPENAGFIAACNAGAGMARGQCLVFLNNDTEVRASWLDALLDTFDAVPECGLVGAKLVGTDGRLQEAGGIVFDDARACNYGRDDKPSDPRYDFLREVDYCSGACIALPADLFQRLGGFDSRYAPAYYEDTDLAFAVRAAGYRVIYQPRAEVVHAEGATAGTDLTAGAKRYQDVNRGKFATKWHDALTTQPAAEFFSRYPQRCATWRRAPHVLVIDADYPRPERDSGSLRMIGILRLMREMGCHVQFWAIDAAARDAHARVLEQLGIEIVLAATPWRRLRWWHAFGAEPDVVWMSRLPAAERNLRLAHHHAPQAKIVFDTVDLHFLRFERGAALAGSAAERKLARRFRRIELHAIQRSDATLVVSDYERSLLRQLVPESDVRVLSNIHAVPGRKSPFQARAGLLFLGNFHHAPNVDAARWLVTEIMPILHGRVPGIALHIAGYASDEVLADLAREDVIVHGFVPDLVPLLEATRVAVAPLRYGAGVKGKINLAMAHGLPVVTTSIGAEGMGLRDGHDVRVADDPAEFAQAVDEVYHDAALWLGLSDHGMENVREHFSPARARRVLSEVLAPPIRAGR
ncbi:MAG TPA: glycosyltransferase [Rhodanobacteraceae bacterium]